jgi:hypothetical protein
MDVSVTRSVLLAAMSICGCHEELMPNKRPTNPPTNDPAPQPSPGAPAAQQRVSLTGETVNISYVSDPAIGHGEFRLNNAGDTPIVAAVSAAWLELGDQHKPLAQFTVFDLAQEHMVDPHHVEVGPKTSLGFLLGFPSMSYEPRFGESAAVGVKLTANGTEVTAMSPLKFIRRIPRTP